MKKVDSRTIEGQRRGLLAKVHIAKKELGLSDGIYREILAREFGVSTAAALSRQEM
jgi:phage gp16-like protein